MNKYKVKKLLYHFLPLNYSSHDFELFKDVYLRTGRTNFSCIRGDSHMNFDVIYAHMKLNIRIRIKSLHKDTSFYTILTSIPHYSVIFNDHKKWAFYIRITP